MSAEKAVGQIFEVIEPAVLRDASDGFFGFIMSNVNETLYFQRRDLRCEASLTAREAQGSLVSFEIVPQKQHAMRKAVNIEIISGATE